MKTHIKALCTTYPFSEVKRALVAPEKIPWDVPWKDYAPQDYTSDVVKNKPVWADTDINAKMQFNKVDGFINRTSFTGLYKLSEDGYPLNPVGRTGLKGRGILGKWGPNHAADPIVTRWKRDTAGNIVLSKSNKKILQFVGIKRKDNGDWAVPGGMVDAGENISVTLKREFGEEALNSLELPLTKKKEAETLIHTLFSKGEIVYQGYVDDPRNTDNAWMETVAMNFHDEDGKSVALLPLKAGDDAGAVTWIDISSNLKLYASHIDFIKAVAKIHKCDW